MIIKAINKLTKNKDLTQGELEIILQKIMAGDEKDVLISSFLTALHHKKETVDEITEAAMTLRQFMTPFEVDQDVLEIVGTGGDKSNSFNISTTSTFVIASSGISVVKHGNRAATSKSGAADVIEALGITIESNKEKNMDIFNRANMVFLYARDYHPSMRYVANVRKELPISTIFNLIGPLANPAKPNYQILGVNDASLVEPLSRVLYNLGATNNLVVYGMDGLDEISVSDKTYICECRNGIFNSYYLDPIQFGFPKYKKEEIVGGTAKENASLLTGILDGSIQGAKKDIVILNSAAAIYLKNEGMSFKQAIDTARELIESGKANQKLKEFIHVCSGEKNDFR